jgi:hypothetical protein
MSPILMLSTVLQIVSALGIIVGLLAAVAAVMYAFCWTVLLLVRFVPVIGRRHRHPRWDELTKRSGRDREVRKVDRIHGP